MLRPHFSRRMSIWLAERRPTMPLCFDWLAGRCPTVARRGLVASHAGRVVVSFLLRIIALL
eukprot:6084164-Heterocapsa_arctica.AAC.1